MKSKFKIGDWVIGMITDYWGGIAFQYKGQVFYIKRMSLPEASTNKYYNIHYIRIDEVIIPINKRNISAYIYTMGTIGNNDKKILKKVDKKKWKLTSKSLIDVDYQSKYLKLDLLKQLTEA